MLAAAEDHYRRQQLLAGSALRAARRAWARHDPSQPRSWDRPRRRLLASLTAVQVSAAADAERYVGEALDEQGVVDDPAALVNATAYAGIASDGRSLDTLLDTPTAHVADQLAAGAAPAAAAQTGQGALERIVATQVADAGRAAVAAAITARPRVSGYVRMLNPPSCARCAVQAGKWFRYNQGFQRHPHCDCRHIPAREDTADELTTDPRAYFESLPTAEQMAERYPHLTVRMRRETGLYSREDVFGRGGAEAIAAGADVGQVVNARRGMYVAGGRAFTREGVTRKGVAGARMLTGDPTRYAVDRYEAARLAEATGVVREYQRTQRLRNGRQVTQTVRIRGAKTARPMPEQIIADADDRAHAVELLRRFGYLL